MIFGILLLCENNGGMLLILLTIDINLIFSCSISWNVGKQGNTSLAAVDSSAFWYHKWKLFFIWKLRQRSYILFLTWKLVLNYSFSLMEKRMWVNLWLQLKQWHVGIKALLKPPFPSLPPFYSSPSPPLKIFPFSLGSSLLVPLKYPLSSLPVHLCWMLFLSKFMYREITTRVFATL